MNQQLVLDLDLPRPQRFENFFPGRNGAACTSVRALALGQRPPVQIHLCGERGSGKSHLLAAAVASAARGRYLTARALAEVPFDPEVSLWAIDDVDAAGPDEQVALFALVNAVRDTPGAALLSAATGAPLALSVREDLRTRLGWGPVFRLEPLSDGEAMTALETHARTRGLTLPGEVARYLLNHFPRNMAALMGIVDALDRYALEHKRALSVPLVQAWLQREQDHSNAA